MADKLFARTQVPGGMPNRFWQEIPVNSGDSGLSDIEGIKNYVDTQIQNLKTEIQQANFLSVSKEGQ